MPGAKGEHHGASSSPRPAPASDDAQPAGQTYVVQSGDSLSKIAKKHYGHADKKIVDAVFAANRDRLPDANTVRHGQALLLPDIKPDVKDNKREPATPARASNHVRDRKDKTKPAEPKRHRSPSKESKPQKTWKWYQVQKGDLYSTIALRELGTSRRWKELFELNRDIFPEPGKIRWGVNIRIPRSASAADSRGSST
jgi:nucleoid-associated protein YgaU